jgi:hypothetical protein
VLSDMGGDLPFLCRGIPRRRCLRQRVLAFRVSDHPGPNPVSDIFVAIMLRHIPVGVRPHTYRRFVLVARPPRFESLLAAVGFERAGELGERKFNAADLDRLAPFVDFARSTIARQFLEHAVLLQHLRLCDGNIAA